MNRSMIVFAALALLGACGRNPDQTENAAVNAATASAEAANASAAASVAANSAAVAAAGAAQTSAAATNAAANTAAAVPADPPTLSSADFVDKAAATDRYEIAAARLALGHATRGAVKAFAQMMIRDHTASTAKLKAAIAASGRPLTLPRDLPPDLQAALAALHTASGPDFDRTYISQMVDTHQQALQTLQAYAAGGTVPALKSFAAAVNPVVQSHLSRAQALQAKVGG